MLENWQTFLYLPTYRVWDFLWCIEILRFDFMNNVLTIVIYAFFQAKKREPMLVKELPIKE